MGRREGEDVHVPHGGGGDKVWNRISLEGEVSSVGERRRGDFNLVPFIEVHQTDVVDGGGVREGHVPRGKIACELCELKLVIWGKGVGGGLRIKSAYIISSWLTL